MSFLASDELRLLYALMLNALVLGAAWRLARRFEPDTLRAWGDALLLFYLVQYLSVAIPGLVGALHPATIALVAMLLAAAMLGAGWARRERALPPSADALARAAPTLDYESGQTALASIRRRIGTAIVAASLAFLLAYVGTLVWHQRQLPVISNDALTYHLPAAVQWLQTGKLGLYEAWFYNPANSYSPLAGSTFIAWLLAPTGNDILARFVEVGPLIVLFVAMINLCRGFGIDLGVAALLALAAVLLRPFVSQSILAKDDLFVAAFFILLIDALRREQLETRAGPWRVGVVLGLLLATKYTVLLSLPVVLLALGRGWNWRRVAIAIIVSIVLAGPWYLRNAMLTGNPLYPTDLGFLHGMLRLQRSDLLRSAGGVWAIFTKNYYGVPPIFATDVGGRTVRFGMEHILILGWLAGLIVLLLRDRRALLRNPLARVAVIGPVLGIALFVMFAPYGEMRFAYPSLLLMSAAVAVALVRLPTGAAIPIAAMLVIASALTAFPFERAMIFTGVGLLAAALAAGAVLSGHGARIGLIVGALAVAAGAMDAYVEWNAYVKQCDADSNAAWTSELAYTTVGDVWEFVRSQLPVGGTVAYANTYFTYPLMGYRFDHRVVYAPTRRDLNRFIDLPRIEERTTGEAIVGHIVQELRKDPDRDQWLRRLRESQAAYLVVMKNDPAAPESTKNPPELTFISQEPAGSNRFERALRERCGLRV